MNLCAKHRIFVILTFVFIATGILYFKASTFRFVNFDDDENIYSNKQHVSLTIENIKYQYDHHRYKALAMWSLMLDNYLFGEKKPGMFHLHNLFLHLLNILLVFLLIFRITKKEFTALIVASLFALHPVFVEPVAWVSGRKDLLFVLFSLLSIFAYRLYLLKKNNLLFIVPVAVCIYLASLAKIQAYTLPFIFIGLDMFYDRKFSAALIIEKLFFISLIADKEILYFSFAVLFIIVYISKVYSSLELQTKSGIMSLFLKVIILFVLLISINYLTAFHKYTVMILVCAVLLLSFILFSIVNIEQAKAVFIKTKRNLLWIVIIVPVILVGFKLIWNGDLMKIYDMNLWISHPGDFNYFNFPERLLLAPYALMIYLARFFLLFRQNPMIAYPDHEIDGSLPAGVTTTAIIVYILLAVCFVLIYKYFRKNKIVILGIIWFLASISIVLHIIPIEGRVIAADRYAYPSYIGLFLIIGSIAEHYIVRYKKIVWSCFALIMVIFCFITYGNVASWRNSKTLWQAALTAKSQNHFALYALSQAYYMNDGKPPDTEKALYYSNEAIKLKADPLYLINRSSIKFSISDFTGALDDLNKAISLDSNNCYSFLKRGIVNQQFNNFKNACSDFKKAIEINKDLTEAGTFLKRAERQVVLDSLIMSEIVKPPDSAEAKQFICAIAEKYIQNKENDKAVIYLNKGMVIFPASEVLYEKLAVMYQLNKDYDKSLVAYNLGLKNLPSNALLLLGRGTLFYEKGDKAKACADWQQSAANGNAKAPALLEQLCGK